jgi:hypothetical protein
MIKITFGKYKNKTIEEIYLLDKSYVFYLSNNAYQDVLKKAIQDFIDSKKSEDKLIKKENGYVINFGKYYGKSLMVAYKDKPRYMNWMLRTFKDDELVQTVVTDFLNHMKMVNKRIRSIDAIRTQRIQDEKLNDANALASKISNLDKNQYYVFETVDSKSGRGAEIFKINDVNVIESDTSVKISVITYKYDILHKKFVKNQEKNWHKITNIPEIFNPENYEVIVLLKDTNKAFDINGNEITLEKNTRINVRIMSDVYVDITDYKYKDVLIYSYGDMVSGVYSNIYSKEKIMTIIVTDVKMFIRNFKISNLIKSI